MADNQITTNVAQVYGFIFIQTDRQVASAQLGHLQITNTFNDCK